MKSVAAFDTFLIDTVNLNKSRADVARTGVGAVTSFLKQSEVTRDYFLDVQPQGSFRQKTIIKPPSAEFEFDVDLLFRMKVVHGWMPTDYLDLVVKAFKGSERYKNIVDRRGKTRCVTLDYESDFHIDVIPAIERGGATYIMNRKSDSFEPSDGDGYASWFESVSRIAGGRLPKVIRLLKYLRDKRAQFEIKSILLTTLVGRRVSAADSPTLYPDVPTAFIALLSRLDQYLQAHMYISEIDTSNPALPSEAFDRHWNQSKFSDFKTGIRDLADVATRAFAEADQAKSDKLWQEIFGSEFPTTSTHTSAVTVTRDAGEEFLSDFGIQEDIRYHINIDAKIIQDGWRPFSLRGYMGLLRKLRSLEFRVISTDVPEPFDVKWKVKNYGQEARNDLRGKILDDDGRRRHIERTKYRGKHYVECYAIKNGRCVAKDHLDVPIGLN